MEKGSHAEKGGPQDIETRSSSEKRSDSGVMEKVDATKRSINVVHCNLVNPEDDSVLVIQRSLNEAVNPGLWEKLSGKIEPDMVGNDAIARNVVKEVEEELGINVKASEVYVSPRENELLNIEHPKYNQVLVHPAYMVYVPRERVSLKENGHCSYKFVRADNYQELPYISGVKDSLTKYFERRREEGILFPHELAQSIRCVIVDEQKERILMRKRSTGALAFPLLHMRSGVAPYTSIQQYLFSLNLADEFKVGPLTAIHLPADLNQPPELHHYFLVSGMNQSLPDWMAANQHQWLDAKPGYEPVCKSLEGGHILRPSIRKVLEKVLFPSFRENMEALQKNAVVRRPTKGRSSSMI